jgi:hypothetical protein
MNKKPSVALSIIGAALIAAFSIFATINGWVWDWRAPRRT